MTVNKRIASLAFSIAVVTACTGQALAAGNTPAHADRLAHALAGKTAGQPVKCLQSDQANQIEVINQDTIIYRDGRTSYVQHASGNCHPNGPGSGYTLVIKHFGPGEICQGDVAESHDSVSGMTEGGCTFNAFTPYR